MIALRGLAAVLFGILALVWPGLTLGALVLLYGAYALVDGVLAIIVGLRGETPHRITMALGGVVGVLAGPGGSNSRKHQPAPQAASR